MQIWLCLLHVYRATVFQQVSHDNFRWCDVSVLCLSPPSRTFFYEVLQSFWTRKGMIQFTLEIIVCFTMMTVSYHLNDKYIQLHPLKVLYEQAKNLGCSLALYSFTVIVDPLNLSSSIVSMIPCMKEKITPGRCCGNGTQGFFMVPIHWGIHDHHIDLQIKTSERST